MGMLPDGSFVDSLGCDTLCVIKLTETIRIKARAGLNAERTVGAFIEYTGLMGDVRNPIQGRSRIG
jgi:hypothetical protein